MPDGMEYLGTDESGDFFARDENGIWRITPMMKGSPNAQLDYMGADMNLDHLT